MREILFKAKRIDNGEWVKGHLIQSPYMGEVRSWISTPEDKTRLRAIATYYGDWRAVEVSTDTICQYTGLTDKNGNNIWENDILMFHSNKNDLAKACYGEFYVVDVETLEKIDTVIGWHYEVIETDAISKCEPFNISMPLTNDYIKTCELEVIGNIFDNKDLIGE